MADLSGRVARDLRLALAVAWLGSLLLWPACSPSKLEGASNVGGAVSAGTSAGGTLAAGSAQAGSDLVLGGGAAASPGGGGGESALGSGGAPRNDACQPPALIAPGCTAAIEVESGALCNGLDDDCDGSVDEGCPCKPGEVQACFRGSPARRDIGACRDGAQVCLRGGEFAARWGDCTGGIRPGPEVCDGLDNDCNGCTDDLDGCSAQWTCPGPGDPRTPDGTPLAPYPLRGRDFFQGAATAWSWVIHGGRVTSWCPARRAFRWRAEAPKLPRLRPS
jgi:hypothetical protein